MVCPGHVGQTVGDQEHRFGLSQSLYLRQDGILTLHVDVGGGFVEKIHRTVVEQRPRQRQPLALPPRQVGRPLQKGRVQPLLPAEKVR